jgi:hypothetical protein
MTSQATEVLKRRQSTSLLTGMSCRHIQDTDSTLPLPEYFTLARL